MTGRASTLAIALLGDRDDGPGADGPATLADGEALAGLEGDRGDELALHLDVVTRPAHLGPVGQPDRACDVGRAEVELGPVAVVEGGMATAPPLARGLHLRRERGGG